jgi:hypothetical protein
MPKPKKRIFLVYSISKNDLSMLITPQLFINMITRIFRIASATKYISLLAKTSGNKSISPIQLMRTQRFSFADGRKNEDPRQPIK